MKSESNTEKTPSDWHITPRSEKILVGTPPNQRWEEVFGTLRISNNKGYIDLTPHKFEDGLYADNFSRVGEKLDHHDLSNLIQKIIECLLQKGLDKLYAHADNQDIQKIFDRFGAESDSTRSLGEMKLPLRILRKTQLENMQKLLSGIV